MSGAFNYLTCSCRMSSIIIYIGYIVCKSLIYMYWICMLHHVFTECRGAFKLFDKNRDGFISTRELLTVLRSLGQDPSDDYIKELLNQYDKDGEIQDTIWYAFCMVFHVRWIFLTTSLQIPPESRSDEGGIRRRVVRNHTKCIFSHTLHFNAL